MKVIFLIDDLMSGGTENNLLNFLRYRDKQFEAKIITLFPGGVLEKSFKEIGLDVECINFSIFGFIKSLKKLKQLICKYSPEVIVCQRAISKACYPLFLSRLNIKIIMHWDNPNTKTPFKAYLLDKFQIKFADANLVSSRIIQKALKKSHHIDADFIIPNCIDAKGFPIPHLSQELNGQSVNLLSVGNLREEKNHIDQLKIAEILKRNGFQFRLDIVGEGHLRKFLEKKIIELDLADHVFLLGRKDNIPELLKNADIFLFTSISEGFGVAIVEAMAAGLPGVIYALPVLQEIDPEEECLKVIPSGDIESAVKTIEDLARNTEIRKHLGENSRKIVFDNFSADRIFKLWESFLSDLGNPKGP